MKNKINTFIFDCFGVILGSVLLGWYNDHCVSKGFIDKDIKEVFRKFDLGEIDENDILNRFLTYDVVDLTREELEKQTDAYLKFDGALVENIKKIKKLSYKVALLSNANSSFFKRKVYPSFPWFLGLFDEIIISSDIKMLKPDRAIYEYALKKIDAKPEECIFLDDTKENVDAAINLGITSFLYTDNDSFEEYIKKIGILNFKKS